MEEVAELYRVRELLEPLLVTDSAPRITPASLELMAELQGRMESHDGLDVESYMELDREFHLLSYSGARLPYVRAQVEQLLGRTQHYRRTHAHMVESHEERIKGLHSDHRTILDAMVRGDAEEASSAMHFHTRRARLELLTHPEVFRQP
jgi:DNA-binding GntR family transcriptional regulator